MRYLIIIALLSACGKETTPFIATVPTVTPTTTTVPPGEYSIFLYPPPTPVPFPGPK